MQAGSAVVQDRHSLNRLVRDSLPLEARTYEEAIIAAGAVETLAGRCGEKGLADGPAADARFSAAVWDVHCAPHDCSVLVADPGNGALRRVTRDPETCPRPPGEARRKGAKTSHVPCECPLTNIPSL